MNNVLLAPEDAGNIIPFQYVSELAGAVAGVQPASDGNAIILPDNHLPPGFVPLSPILPNTASFPSNPPQARAPSVSPQPPAYTPREIYSATLPRETSRDIYANPPSRPATAMGTHARSPAMDGAGGRPRGASIGSALLQTSASPAPLNRPLSIFSVSDS